MTNRKIAYWVIPPDADGEYVAQMEEVLDVYARPYNPECPVICMDEQPVPLHKETRQPIEAERARQLGRRIEFCYTPKHGSWLNVAKNELSTMTRQCVDGRRFGDIETLRDEIAAWSTDVNSTQRGVDWQMKVEDARYKLTSIYPQIKL